MGYSYDRRAGEQKDKFESLFDLGMYLEYERGDWRKGKSFDKKNPAFIKRFGGVWMRLGWYDSPFSFQVFLRPTTSPKNIDYSDKETWDAWLKATGYDFDLRKTTLSVMERKATELAKVHKTFAKRQPKDTSGWHYNPRGPHTAEELTGKEAYKAWLRDVQDVLQEEVDNGARQGFDFTTQSLVGNILDNYGIELVGMGRSEMARSISRLLNAMARAGKIEKDTNNPREPRWVGLNWVSKPKRRW